MASVRILLLVTGGIAAYKACLLTRLLVQAGFSVRVAMTDSAARFVTPMTFKVLTGAPVATDLWGEGQTSALDHIEYSRWADIAVVAPATANNMAKAAHGIADDMVTTQLLAFPGPVLMAPAMNDNMWRNAATQANREILAGRGVAFVGPGSGFLACGTTSDGRMAEPEEILAAVQEIAAVLPERPIEQNRTFSETNSGYWLGRSVIITAGPTFENIDPVRYLGNRSSGVFGYALASAAVQAGARVTLISGPVDLVPPRGLTEFVKIESALQLADSVTRVVTACAVSNEDNATQDDASWLIMAAAVADFRPARVAENKIKKEDQGDTWTIELERNPDILADVVANIRTSSLQVVGFALETENLLERARAKMQAKKMDYIVANDPTAIGSGFGPGEHRVVLMGKNEFLWESESMPKTILAEEILARLAVENGSIS